MRILLVYANTLRMLAPAPLGASLVAARLRRDGHQVRLLDLMFARSATAATAREARQFGPDLVAFSLRNRDSQSATDYYDCLPIARAVVAAAREAAPQAPVLLGGTAFTTFPVAYLRELAADYGLAGDDLEPISHFVATLAAGAPDLETPGLVYWEGERGRGTARANPFAIKGYADQAFDGWDFLDLRPYRRNFWTFCDGAVVARTGCPFGCVYCDTFRTYGQQWVLREPRQVAEEVLALRRHGARSVWLADAGFNRPLHHAKAVLAAILAARPGVSFDAVFEPGEVDAEFAHLFRRAGGRSLMVFAGSLADEVLAAQHKPFTTSDVLDGIQILHKAGIQIAVALSLGGPGETRETVAETLGRAASLPAMYQWVERGFRLQPQTPLRQLAMAEGVIDAADDCFRAVFYHSPATPPAWLDEHIKAFQKARGFGGPASLGFIVGYLANKAAAWLGWP